MKNFLKLVGLSALACVVCTGAADGRGFGRFGGGGGFRAGGFRAGGFNSFGGASTFHGASAFRGGGSFGSFSADRSASGFRLGGAGAGTRSYDRNYTGPRGASINAAGTRGYAYGPRGAAAGGTRDVTATGPRGRTYSNDSRRGVAVGPYGRVVGGGSGTRSVSGFRGSASRSWQSAFAGSRFPTDAGLAHYSSFSAGGVRRGTTYWSRGYVTTHAGFVRGNFAYYNCFRPRWYVAHPGCWFAAGWAAGAAWQAANWATLATFCAIPAVPVDYDYGSTVVYQNNNVYVNGQDEGTTQAYAQQAVTLADQGQKANAPPTEQWKALGVFALVQGDAKTSNNIFQLAVNKDGVIRGNYYNGLMDSTTPVYGSVNKKTQRAAWTIGKKNDRVFDAGFYNLTKSETPVLVHLGDTRTEQMLLVRVQQPKDAN